jgi:hypothetical protein
VRAGVSDFVFLHEGRFYALELKALGGKPPTEEQQSFISDVNNAGGFAVCATGLDLAIKCLEAWGLVKGKAVTFEQIGEAAARVVNRIGRKKEEAA